MKTPIARLALAAGLFTGALAVTYAFTQINNTVNDVEATASEASSTAGSFLSNLASFFF